MLVFVEPNLRFSFKYFCTSAAEYAVGVELFELLELPLDLDAAALAAALLAGALWGSIPGLLKALCNVNEVISCIMMNYIGMYLVNFLITRTVFDSLKNQSQRVGASATDRKSTRLNSSHT